jgi:hypothetical protein
MSENAIVVPNMEHAYWGVKCKNPECPHYILREDLGLQPEGTLAIPPEPYPNFDQPCEHCGQTHMYARNDVQVVKDRNRRRQPRRSCERRGRTNFKQRPRTTRTTMTRDSESKVTNEALTPKTNRNPASALTRRSGP